MIDESLFSLKNHICLANATEIVKESDPSLYPNNIKSLFFFKNLCVVQHRVDGGEKNESRRIEGRDEGQDERNVPYKIRTTPIKNNHPTVKPIKLMEYLIKLVSKEGAIVLDPFLGSGTTAIACLKTNRNFIGIEKESEYIKIAEARIKPFLEQTKLPCEIKPI